MEHFAGTLRVKAKNFDKNPSKYQKYLDEGYIYNRGCGRFTKQICNCCKCKKK